MRSNSLSQSISPTHILSSSVHGAKLVGLTLCYLANLQCSCGLKEGILTCLHDRRKWILLVAALRELDFMSHRAAERGYFSLIILSDAISRDYKSHKYLVTVSGAAVSVSCISRSDCFSLGRWLPQTGDCTFRGGCGGKMLHDSL